MSLGLFCTYLLGLSLGAYLSLENIPSTLELYLGCKAQEIRTWVISGVLLFAGASLVIGGRAILICALFLGIFQSSSAWTERRALTLKTPPTLQLTQGEVCALHPHGLSWWLRIKISLDGDDLVIFWRTETRPHGVGVGAKVWIQGQLQAGRAPAEQGAWSQRRWLKSMGASFTGKGPLELAHPAPRHTLLLAQLQSWISQQLNSESNGAALLRGLLLGDPSRLSQAHRDALRALGLAHLLAVSGFHIGGLATLSYFIIAYLASLLGFFRPARPAALIATFTVLSYCTLCGAPISAKRAALMSSLFLIAKYLGYRAEPLRIWGLVALFLTLEVPIRALELGSQLSFLSTFGLIVLCPRSRWGWLWVPLIAWSVTSPILCAHLGVCSWAAPLVNPIYTPLFSILILLSGLGLILTPFSSVLLMLCQSLATVLVDHCLHLHELIGGTITLGTTGTSFAAIPFALLCLYIYGPTCRKLRLLFTALIVLALSLFARLSPLPQAQVSFLSVGQGDAILLQDQGRYGLVDAGPPRSSRALLGALSRRGIRHLEWIALSHLDSDHRGGVDALLTAGLLQGPIYLHPDTLSGSRAQTLISQWRGLHPNLVVRAPRARGQLGRLRLKWLTFQAPLSSFRENDRALILRVEGPGASLLLSGDLEERGEHMLLSLNPKPVDFFKANHHGSRGSNHLPLLRRLDPRLVIYSLGEKNRFHFPHREVEER
ncbi:MAG: ComEC/Rec2 family competence protein, partial [Myxococcota bacterium]|nr:ComEC/Rec2 family competence protein [Myxococcota bacterium]